MTDLSGKSVLVLTSEFAPLRGGIATYAAGVASGAAQLGARVALAAPDYGDRARLSEADAGEPFEVLRFSGARHTFKDAAPKYLWLSALLARREFDIVLAADWPFFLPLALQKGSARRLFMLHGTELFEMRAPHKRAAIAASGLFRASSMRAHGFEVVANSRFTLDLFHQHHPGAAAERCRSAALGVDRVWLEPGPSRRDARQRFAIPEEAFVVATLGRMTPRKGQIHALRAMRQLPAELRRRLRYDVIGPHYDERYTAEVRSAAAGVDFPVKLWGDTAFEVVKAYFSACDVFCLVPQSAPPEWVEGFGLVFLEAGACGVPSVAGDVGGVPDAVEHGETGLLVAPQDPGELTAALARMAQDRELRQRLAIGARRRAEAFSWARCAGLTFGEVAGAPTGEM